MLCTSRWLLSLTCKKKIVHRGVPLGGKEMVPPSPSVYFSYAEFGEKLVALEEGRD